MSDSSIRRAAARWAVSAFVLSAILSGPAGCAREPSATVSVVREADTVYRNGVVVTIDDEKPIAEAVAVKQGKVIAVGTEAEVMETAGEATHVIDLRGRTMLPGFVDSHGHAYGIGLQATSANLLPPPDGTGRNIAALQQSLNEWRSTNDGPLEKTGWIVGFGYDDAQLAEGRHPTRDDLDEVSTDLPVLIIHQSGHLGVGNSKALELAGVTAATKDPEGGVFRRRKGSREPNGVCEEYAFFYLLGQLLARFDDDINDTLVEEGAKLVASFGYTTAQEGRAMGPALAAMKRVADRDRLSIDLVAYPDILEVEDVQPSLSYDHRYRVGGVKLTIDGSPQGKTAWLREPYYVVPDGLPDDYRGYAAVDEETTMNAVEKAFANDWQILCHANGDAAIDRFIQSVRAAKEKHPESDNRPVLIHGQVLRADQV